MAYADPGRDEVNKLLAKIEKRIEKQYTQATREVTQKLNNYLKSFAAKDKEKQKLVKAGKLTQEEYNKWRLGQIMIGERWKEMRDTLATDLTNADKVAMNMINSSLLPEAYAISHNYGTFEVEKGSLVDTSYTLYDRDTVARLIGEYPDLLPKPKVNIPTDKLWNRRHIDNAITQGILQGEDIGKIANRLRSVSDMDKSAAIRNARTMTTSAENAGRQDSYARADSLGIKMVQVWVATLDSRTRDTHRELDGQERPVGEPFKNSLGEIRYPGDPEADPANVYNCRCTLIAKVKESKIGEALADRQNSQIGRMSYSEWKSGHKIASKAASISIPPRVIPDFSSLKMESVLTPDKYDEVKTLVNKAETKALFNQYSERADYKPGSKGFYDDNNSTVNFSSKKMDGRSEYSTLFHETGHMVDYKSVGDWSNLHFTENEGFVRALNGSSGYFSYGSIFPNRPSQSDEFLAAIRSDAKRLESIYATTVAQELISTTELRNASSGVQDFIDGMFNTQDRNILPWGHGGAYYNRYYNRFVSGIGNRDKDLKALYTKLGFDAGNIDKRRQITRIYDTASEAWANVSSALTVGGKEKEVVEKYMPDTVAAYRKIIQGVK